MNEQTLEMIELEIAILYRRITSISTPKKSGNLDRSAYLLLHQIVAHESAGVKALADKFQLDISTVSRQAAALEHKGYIERKPDPTDGRAYFLEITELGMKEYLAYKQARLVQIEKSLGSWSDEETRTFGQLLQKFNHTFNLNGS